MKGNKNFSTISGLLFIACSIFDIVYCAHQEYLQYFDVLGWISILIFAGVGITILIGQINIGTVVMFGVDILIQVIYFFTDGFSLYSFSLYSVITYSVITFLISLLFLICCIMVISKNAKNAKIVSFIPVGLFILNRIIEFDFSIQLIYTVLIIAAYVLLALYINSIQFEEAHNIQISINSNLNTVYIGTADKLLQYKELLDIGIISKEEFEEKKKQALGL